jgi:hypothetical protein
MRDLFFATTLSFLGGFYIAYSIFYQKSPTREEMIREKAKLQLEREIQAESEKETELLAKQQKELNKGFINN